jgi:4-hydroxybenzoate polyprenyltransferase
MKTLVKKINSFLTQIEESPSSVLIFLAIFYFITNLRNFVEIFSDGTCFGLRCFAHYQYGYLWVATTLILITYYFFEKNIVKHAKVILFFFAFIWLAPTLDLIISGGKDEMLYLHPYIHGDMLKRFFFFWSIGDDRPGATPGIKIEIAIILLSFFYFSYLFKKASIKKSLLFIFFTYSTIFIYGMFPFLSTGLLDVLGLNWSEFRPKMHADYFLLLIFFNGLAILHLHEPKYFKELLKDLRYLRIGHYLMMMACGFALGLYEEGNAILKWDQRIFFDTIITSLALVFACLFSIITNNLADLEIDKVTNRERPLIKKSIPLNYYKKIGILSLAFSFIYAANVNFQTFYCIMLFIGNYYLYSMPPMRLKRVPVLSKLFISINSLLMLILGKFTLTGNFSITPNLAIYFLVCITLVINFIDLKDVEGDRKAGINTIPTLLGLKVGKKIIGLFFIMSYGLAYPILKTRLDLTSWDILPLLICGLIAFGLINRNEYSEKPVFLFYLSSIGFLGAFFIFR